MVPDNQGTDFTLPDLEAAERWMLTLAYAVDLLARRHGLSLEVTAGVLSPPLWSEIEHLDPESRDLYSLLRQVYPSLLMTGPFAIVVGRTGEMMGLTDRIRLRPMIAATRGPMLYLSSEEAAIRLVCPDVEDTWMPLGGEPVIGRVSPEFAEPEAAPMAARASYL